ncbi:hypothetical protein VNO77_41641 [Canavalia gladiata]|uniref:Pre-rRNA-processing protein TSR2 homolog n=1 Tax=Canavalia gladiata TaxID=3824 RepID=A0AAN9JYV9_CANGL
MKRNNFFSPTHLSHHIPSISRILVFDLICSTYIAMQFLSFLLSLCVLCGYLFLPTHIEPIEVLLMDSININNYGRIKTNPSIYLQESIILLLSRWYALQMAVQNQWGGCDSLQKSHKLAADLFLWFSNSNAPIPVEDLENLLHESLLLIFNTEIEDGSIEQVAEQLMVIHEEYLSHQLS